MKVYPVYQALSMSKTVSLEPKTSHTVYKTAVLFGSFYGINTDMWLLVTLCLERIYMVYPAVGCSTHEQHHTTLVFCNHDVRTV